MQHTHSQQSTPTEQRSLQEAANLRKEARGTPPGIERERLLRRARQAETASRVSEWLASKGLQPPT
jgi:predicted trehalose synthase